MERSGMEAAALFWFPVRLSAYVRTSTFQWQGCKGGLQHERPELVRQIEKGNYPGYHVRKINNVKTPASNLDKSENNNLD